MTFSKLFGNDESPMAIALCALVPEVMCRPITKFINGNKNIRNRARREFVSAYCISGVVARYAKENPPKPVTISWGLGESIKWALYVGPITFYSYAPYASGDLDVDMDFRFVNIEQLDRQKCVCEFCCYYSKLENMAYISVIWRRHTAEKTLVEVIHSTPLGLEGAISHLELFGTHTEVLSAAKGRDTISKQWVIGPRDDLPRTTILFSRWTCDDCMDRLKINRRSDISHVNRYLATWKMSHPSSGVNPFVL